MSGRFEGQTAIVTGAGSAEGIGFAVARLLYEEGARVAITSTTERIFQRANEIDSEGERLIARVADLTREAQVSRFVQDVMAWSGRIDILVNNAGMAQAGVQLTGHTLDESSFENWQKQEYGRIVNVSSVTGPLVSNIGSSAYGAAKAGMDGMMRAAALETARNGITINGVAPGWIATASSTESEREAARYTPVGRAGTPDEVAAAACFLASREASYITGQSLVVDGGNILQENKAPR